LYYHQKALKTRGYHENRLYGDIWLLEQIAGLTGIRSDLIKTFEGNTEITDAVMTMAMFLLCGKGTYNQLASWQKISRAPYARPLTSVYVTKLTQMITEDDRMTLLKCRASRLSKEELCAVDSTSRSAWGDSLADIRYGKNKDHLPLPQTLEVVVYTLDGHMPVYYRSFQGNTPDSRTLATITKDLYNAGFRNVVLITDRGYESIRNLEMYIDNGQPMIMGTKTNQKHVLKEIDKFGTFDHHPDAMEIDPETRLYYKQYDLDYQIEGQCDNVKKAHKLKLNLYFDPGRRARELTDMDIAIADQKAALQDILDNRAPLDDDLTIKRAYCYHKLTFDQSSRILKSFALDDKKVQRGKREAGFFANTTHMLDIDAMTANSHYRLRDEQEKYFSMMKGILRSDRQRNWSEDGKNGRQFILFVAQILGCYLSHIRKTKLAEHFDSTESVLNEMRPIRYVEHPNTVSYITPFVGKQVEICEAFGISIPEGCAPEYVVRSTSKGKRGRPRKTKLVVQDK
jgi:transposase